MRTRFRVHYIKLCFGVSQIQHQDFQLNKQRLATAGSSQNHTIAVYQLGTKPHNQISGHSVNAVKDTTGIKNFMHIERYKSAQALGKHSAHTGNAPQAYGIAVLKARSC